MVITIFANIAYLRDFQPTKRVQVPFSALNENPRSFVIENFRDFSLLNIQKLGKDRAHQTTFIIHSPTYKTDNSLEFSPELFE